MSNPTSPLDLGTLPVSKLLKQYAFPAIVAMTASSLYNMVDSIFIGHGVGPLAISGLALTFPFMNLSAAFGAMVGIGASTLISVRLGQQDYTAAQDIFGNVVTLTLILGVLFSIVALVFLDPILSFFGASPATLPYAREYMEIILLGNVITHSFFTFNAILRSTGHPQLAMNATIMAVVGNTILNPIFIYGMNMGIRGAATATILAQIVSLLWQVSVFRRPKELIQFKRGIYRLKKKIVKDTFAIGMSPFLMNMASCFIVILINQGLKEYGGDLAIGAFGIVNRIIFVFIMIVLGLNQGMQPIAGYNFGAKLYPRVTEVLKATICCATVVTTIGFLIGMFIPEIVPSIFTSDAELISIASKGFRVVVFFYPIVGFQMVASNFFQSIGMASKAIFLSLTRQMLFLVPCLLVLPHYYGQIGVWASMPVADLAASLISGGMLWWQFRQFKKVTV